MAKCGCECDCTGIAVVAGLILGVIAAFLRITGVITVTPAFLWVTFGIGVVYLAVTLVTAGQVRLSNAGRCVCSVLPVLLTAILGTILLSVILLAVEFAATSVIGAIITGGLIGFFAITLGTVACLIRCILGCTQDSCNL